ncbi:hypothetical protein [Reichenbachiella sp.]|uniref:hypothetical protein n=1 Tax=Reichenbachiella sp. TaxID=2184521 RepID=UPI003B5A7018
MMRYLATFVLVMCYLSGFSQPINYNQPYNSTYLAKYGISPKIFNLILSPMYQEEASFTADWKLRDETNNKSNDIQVQMDYDPHYAYGNQLFIIVKDEKVYERMPEKKIKGYVSRQNEKFKELQGFDLIEESDVGLIYEEGDSTVLGFNINKSRLPLKIKRYSKLQGRVFLKNGDLQRITLSSSNFKSENIKHNEFLIELSFVGNKNTGYLLSKYLVKGKGLKKKENYTYNDLIEVISYQSKEKEPISEYPISESTLSSTGISDTFKIKLERSMPFLGNAARKAGYELPLPWGINLFNHFQTEQFGLNNIILNDINLSELVLEEANSTVDADIAVVAGMGDVWILPFLNLSVLYGRIGGSTNVILPLTEEMKDLLGWIGDPVDQINFNVDVAGSIGGFGMTAAGGYKNLFATVAGQYMIQTSEGTGTTVKALVVTPLIGLRMPRLVNFMVGAQYQYTDTDLSGSFKLDGVDNDFSLTLKPKTWNFMVGIQRDISNRFSGAFQVGIGDRKSSTLVIAYRF